MGARSSKKQKDVQIETTATLKGEKRRGGMVATTTKTQVSVISGKARAVFKATLGKDC